MNVNTWAILAAAAASFIFGGLWYTGLSKPWLAALGKSETELKAGARPMPLLIGISIVGLLIMAWVFSGLMIHLAKGGIATTPRTGALVAFFCWLGFVATTLASNHGYQGRSWRLTLIDSGHWLGVLLIQGMVIGWLGVR